MRGNEFGPNPDIIRQNLGSHETSRRAANGRKALRNLVLAAARGCSLRLAVANAFISWTCRHHAGTSSPLKRDIGYTPSSASPLLLLSSSLEGLCPGGTCRVDGHRCGLSAQHDFLRGCRSRALKQHCFSMGFADHCRLDVGVGLVFRRAQNAPVLASNGWSKPEQRDHMGGNLHRMRLLVLRASASQTGSRSRSR